VKKEIYNDINAYNVKSLLLCMGPISNIMGDNNIRKTGTDFECFKCKKEKEA